MTSKHLADLKFDPNNARKHTPRNIHMIEDSLQTVGAGRSILIDEDDVILAGNGVVEAAASAGIERVRVIEADGDEIIAVRRSNLTPEQKTKMALFDNRTAELATWDAEVLTSLKGKVDMDDLWFDDEFDRMIEQARQADGEVLDDDDGEDEDNPYSQKVDTPIYTPTLDEPPAPATLYDTSKRDTLVAAITNADLPDDVRSFLLAAAERHVVFDYQNIAEFYAHADPDVQALMEDSALVIIDLNKAIEHGYVRAKERFLDMIASGQEVS